MLYLLDANVLIDADRDYYPLDRVPEFWEWLCHQAAQGHLKVPREIYDEIAQGTGELVDWITQPAVKHALLLDENPDMEMVRRVVNGGYAGDLTDLEVNELGRDPFLVAYALARPTQRCVITNEVSKPKRVRANRHIPDVCDALGMDSKNSFFLIRALNFSTGWRRA